MIGALLLVGFALSTVLTGVARRSALKRRVLDVPTGRSSHTVPTPRGGGIAFVSVFVLLLCAVPLVLQVPVRLLVVIVTAAGSMAVLGFADDHKPLPARWRLLAHFVAAAWALASLGPGWIPQVFGESSWMTGLGYGLSAIGFVWMLNLYNFMDGIDGIASIEAITVCVPAALLWRVKDPAGAWPAPLLLACCVAGFLLWNFPPARIFMGDAGSNFLGAIFGVFAMESAVKHPELIYVWGILLGGFIVDATVTLLRRLAQRERVFEAHRSHAYQYAARTYGSHRPVSLALAAINIVWLCPIATAVALGYLRPAVGIALAFAPLGCLAYRYKAGLREEHRES